MTDHLDLDALLDGYITEYDDGGFTELRRPDLYDVAVDGQTWVTNRHFLFRLDALLYSSDDWCIHPMPAKSADAARQWVFMLRAAELEPSTAAEFAPAFGGVLTLAGYTAHAIRGWTQMHALVDAAGERTGILMPYTEPSQRSVPIPCSAEMIAMYRRLNEADVARQWQCWEFAALLTNGLR